MSCYGSEKTSLAKLNYSNNIHRPPDTEVQINLVSYQYSISRQETDPLLSVSGSEIVKMGQQNVWPQKLNSVSPYISACQLKILKNPVSTHPTQIPK